MFDRIVVGVVRHPTHKEPFFTIEQRLELLQEVLSPFPNVVVAGFSTLVVEYARAWGAMCAGQGTARRLRLRVGIANGAPQ